MNAWKDILKRLYDKGMIDEERLHNSVTQGLITEEEMNEILGIEE